MQGNNILFKNGVVLHAKSPPVATFLEAHPGAYTTTRTHNNGESVLFWERHMSRLSHSFKLMLEENPILLFEKPDSLTIPFWEWELANRKVMWDGVIHCLVNDCMKKAIGYVVKERKPGDELAITALVGGCLEELDPLDNDFHKGRVSGMLDVYLHIGGYVPPVFGVSRHGAHLAVVGGGRKLSNAKYSEWVRLRKPLEKLRPPHVTELLLSNDGDQILEGCLTNFFVVCYKEKKGDDHTVQGDELHSLRSLEVQTAPITDGVLPGVIRQVIIDVCRKMGIPFREVAPSWSKRDSWTEAFITNALRIVQHVETIRAPDSWKLGGSNTWEEITWVEKQFEDGPGRITSLLQNEILKVADVEAFPLTHFKEGNPLA